MKAFAYVLFLLFFTMETSWSFNIKNFSEVAEQSATCSYSKDHLWNALYKEIERSSFQEIKRASTSKRALFNSSLGSELNSFLELTLVESIRYFQIKNKQELIELLTAIELGDQTTPQKKSLKEKVEAALRSIEKKATSLSLECDNSDEERIYKKNRSLKSFLPTPSDGVSKTLSTFYQSCEVLELSPVRYSDPDVQGVSITGTHSDGVGKKRVVSSVTKVNSTHHYLKNIASYGEGCINIKNSPPIYDYGGKPYASSEVNSPLNFFKNAGSGTSAMGIDCSGLVFSNLASVGLKLKSSGDLKAISVNGVSSTMLSNPSANGLDCLERVTFKESDSLRVGDIISKPGHTVSVFSVGEDPFGVKNIINASDCTSSKISSSRFDFTVVHSSPIKGGIGVNRIPASDFLKLHSSWSNGFMFYAIKACKAKFGVYSSSASSDKLAIVRHKGTANCIASPVALTGESCVSTCGM